MTARLLLPLTAVWLTWPVGSAAAEAPRRDAPLTRRPNAVSHVFLMERRGADRALVISYPWKIHYRPSVEVRLLTGKPLDPPVLRPLFFLKQYMKGEVLAAIYRCEDKATSTGVRESLKAEEDQFEIIGRRNWLGRSAVCVLHRFPEDGPAPGATAVFCLLSPWAINERLLHLDLPREEFAQPGTLYVWCLRDGAVLWREVVPWPGQGSGEGGMTKHE